MSKKCGKCKIEKDESLFDVARRTKDGLQNWCMDCDYSRNRGPTSRDREYRVEKLYGMTRQEYMVRCEKQNDRCTICEDECKLHIDHDDATSVVRGLICTKCNMALGLFKHDSSILRAAANYLDAAPKTPDWKRQLMSL